MTPPDPRTTQALTLADEVAGQMFARFFGRTPLGDLQSIARLAALQAAPRWDGRGHFARFTVQRIRWAVLDALRSRRRLGPQADPESLRQVASLATERAADALALETAESAARLGNIGSLDSIGSLETSGAAQAGEAANPTAAMQAFLNRAAAAYAVDLDSAGVLEIADPNVDVEGEVDRLRVRRAVAALPPDERTVMERHGYGGETFEEIAAAEGARRSTVFSRYARGLESLRRALGAEG